MWTCPKPTEAEERFWARADVLGADECWPWLGYMTSNGYGRAYFAGRNDYAHRVAYTLRHGSIPEGLQIDHLCRVRHCVNPDHLEAVTQKENLMRGESPMARNARATHCKHGHAWTPENTYVTPNGRKRHCVACSRQRKREGRARGVR